MGARRDARVQKECEKGRDDECEQAIEQAAGQVTCGGMGFLAR